MSNHTLGANEPIILKDESGTPLVLGDFVLDSSGWSWLISAYTARLVVGLSQVGVSVVLVKDGIPGNMTRDFFTMKGRLLGYTKEA